MATIKKQVGVLNEAITINVPTDQSALVTAQLPTSWAGTAVVEGTVNEVDWVAIGMVPAAGGAAVASMAAAGMWTGERPAAYEQVRLRVSVAGAGGIAALSVVRN